MRHVLVAAALIAAELSLALTAAAQVVAVPDSGSAHPGALSKPIANVAVNDTINGAQATLGSSGNATVAKSGTWPTGITLLPSTGGVYSSNSIVPGVYSVTYTLCDKSSNCANATDTVTIITVTANPDSGSAVAGVASTPILNVASNDSVNGAAGSVGSGGNSTVSQVGSWPTGITLNPLTGGITVGPTVPPGTYTVQYQICDKLPAPDCATAADTITVTTSIVANPDSGNALSGTAATAIANIAANDFVNGAAAVLGTSGNATVAQFGNWSTGISLNPAPAQ